MRAIVFAAWLLCLSVTVAAEPEKKLKTEETKDHQKVQAVIDQVEKACIDRTVYMVGRKKAERLAELVRKAKPRRVLECGTAIGYSGLWIARELQAAGKGGKPLLQAKHPEQEDGDARCNLLEIRADPEAVRQDQQNGREKYFT